MAGIYIHIPFCHSKCAYCDFYSSPSAESLIADYVEALKIELDLRHGEIPKPYTTLYIGGGTPSILPLDILADLIGAINQYADIASLREFTIEVNPEDVSASLLREYSALGIRRVSMGVQSFDDRCLAEINRRHDAATAIKALEQLAASEMVYSADLIYGLPGQSIELWKASLDRLLSFRPHHFSAYLLSYEPGTRLYARMIAGKVEEAPDEIVDSMYGILIETAAQNGYDHYEISNFALPGYRAIHNSSYWDMTPYLGLGASAHSFDGSTRRVNPADMRRYIKSLKESIVAYGEEPEDPLTRLNDTIITGLRTSDGLDLAKASTSARFDEMMHDARTLISSGSLIEADGHLRIPEREWLRSDAIMRHLIRID